MKSVLFAAVLLTLAACSPSEQHSDDTHSSDKVSLRSPELSSLGFLNAIYVDRDVEKAKLYVNDSLKEILGHYYIASSVQRYVLNLSMTDVQLEVDEVDIDFFRKFTDDVTVIVKIKGLRGGQDWIDDRTIRLHKRNDKWIIVEIMPEKRQVNG
nr:hypothetical protein [Shewanella pealeana]